MLPRVPDTARVPTRAVCKPHGVCLLSPIRTERAALSATPFASLGKLLSSHRAITRVSLAAISFTVIAAFSQQPPVQAGPPVRLAEYLELVEAAVESNGERPGMGGGKGPQD